MSTASHHQPATQQKTAASAAERERRRNLRNHLILPLAAVVLAAGGAYVAPKVGRGIEHARANRPFGSEMLGRDRRARITLTDPGEGILTAVTDIYGPNITKQQANDIAGFVQENLPPDDQGNVRITEQLLVPLVPGVPVVDSRFLEDTAPPLDQDDPSN